MYENDDIGQNTLYVNDILVRLFKLVLVAIAAVVVLKALGIIALPWLHLVIIAGIGTLASVIPIICRHFRTDGNGLKHVNIYCAFALCTLGYCYLNMGFIMLLVMPIGFSCLYFDIKLIRQSAALSAVGLVLWEVISVWKNWGFAAAEKGSYIRIAVYILQFGITAALLIAISKRALKMLSNTYSFYENINNILSNAQVSSQNLEAAEDILLQGISTLDGNNGKDEEPLTSEEDAAPSNLRVRAIISNINKSMDNAKDIIKYTRTMLRGKDKDFKGGDEIERMEEYTRNSKELISNLANYIDKIKEDFSLISVMIDESKLLSTNAAAEAENSSSLGKGSAIIAMKVEKLADESAESATHIQELLRSIVNDAENTVSSVAATYEEIFKSLELINRTVETLIKWLMYKNMK